MSTLLHCVSFCHLVNLCHLIVTEINLFVGAKVFEWFCLYVNVFEFECEFECVSIFYQTHSSTLIIFRFCQMSKKEGGRMSEGWKEREKTCKYSVKETIF